MNTEKITDMQTKPNVLILGGCGFLGRHIVDHLVTNHLVAHIRVVDKTPPQMAWLNQRHTAQFADTDTVQFVSANLIDPASCARAFAFEPSPNENGGPTTSGDSVISGWDIVINCAAETRPDRMEAVHAEGTVRLSLNCARLSRKLRVRRYVELSSGNMHKVSAGKKPANEQTELAPWTAEARHKAVVEKRLMSSSKEDDLEGLEFTVVRLPLVYGPGDRRGLIHRISIAAIYGYLGDTMKLLWSNGLRLNTVHVSDAAAAIWHLANHEDAVRQVYNVVDDSQTTQGTISDILESIYHIRVDYWGNILSRFAKRHILEALNEINEKHLAPWAKLCENHGILNTPLSPFMDEESLTNNNLHLDNAKLKSTGFQLKHPLMTRALVEDIIKDFSSQKLMPAMPM